MTRFGGSWKAVASSSTRCRSLDDLGVSVDLRLHNVFWQPALPELHDVDIVVGLDADPYAIMEARELDEVVLRPHEFVLGETAESLALPPHLCGWIEGKSGRARLGIECISRLPRSTRAGEPAGRPKRITLEIVNNNRVPIRLRAGAPIAQVVFHELRTPLVQPYAEAHARKGSQA